ncbi:unnamed protein product [Victoria cruziana]
MSLRFIILWDPSLLSCTASDDKNDGFRSRPLQITLRYSLSFSCKKVVQQYPGDLQPKRVLDFAGCKSAKD